MDFALGFIILVVGFLCFPLGRAFIGLFLIIIVALFQLDSDKPSPESNLVWSAWLVLGVGLFTWGAISEAKRMRRTPLVLRTLAGTALTVASLSGALRL